MFTAQNLLKFDHSTFHEGGKRIREYMVVFVVKYKENKMVFVINGK